MNTSVNSSLPVINKQEYDAFAVMYRTGKKYRGRRYDHAFYCHFQPARSRRPIVAGRNLQQER